MHSLIFHLAPCVIVPWGNVSHQAWSMEWVMPWAGGLGSHPDGPPHKGSLQDWFAEIKSRHEKKPSVKRLCHGCILQCAQNDIVLLCVWGAELDLYSDHCSHTVWWYIPTGRDCALCLLSTFTPTRNVSVIVNTDNRSPPHMYFAFIVLKLCNMEHVFAWRCVNTT